jgi:hypothetical protein
MASNNYAEVMTDSTKAQRVLAELEGMAARGCRVEVGIGDGHAESLLRAVGTLAEHLRPL